MADSLRLVQINYLKVKLFYSKQVDNIYMLDTIQFILSLQIIGVCLFGGTTLLLRACGNRAKRFLGWSMYLWAVLVIVRVSVNMYVADYKETFNSNILIIGCLVMASLACYIIEVLRPGYLTLKRLFIFLSPVYISGLAYCLYRLSGGEVHTYYSIKEVFEYCNMDMFLRVLTFMITLFYMSLPAYLVMRYSKGFNTFVRQNVSDPEDYDLEWLQKTMIIQSALYIIYLVLLLTDSPGLYVIDKVSILILWYYFFYKALFLKVIVLEHSFEKGWDLPYELSDNTRGGEDEEAGSALFKRYADEVHAWFEKEKPYLRSDLRLTDLQRVFPISRSYLSLLFNRELGQPFSDYVNQFRIEESKRLMEVEPQAGIQDIAERSGFHSISTFRRAFQKYTGTTPSEYKKG